MDAGTLTRIQVPLTVLPEGEGLPLPDYMSPLAAGMDLRAAITDDLTLPPGARTLVPCGFRIALPEGFEAQIRPRSGLALRHGITLINAPGTVDADYRGPIQLPVINLGQEPYTIRRGDRLAQMIVAPVVRVEWEVHENLEDTARGEGGFGHTGR